MTTFRLKTDQVLAIRSSSLSGPTLAAIYGVARSTIQKVRNRQRWPHTPAEQTS